MTERAEEKPSGYPPALEKYEDVIVDPKLFRETLEKLHHKLGTKFMIPTVGGKELDLHKLFVEVTARGGIEKVIKDRRWKEITAGFSFPSTATNASFVLRKYYLSLLHHYEQIYFLNFEVPPGIVEPSRNEVQADKSSEALVPALENPVSGTKRRRNLSEAFPEVLTRQHQFPVSGVIDGKFEHGYFVTVWKDGQKMQGVLYHVHDKTPAQAIHPVSTTVRGTHRRRRRRKLSKLDPTHPKPNRSGYNFFFAEQHARLKPLHPGKDREISRMIGDLWNNLTETDKAVYQEIGLKDKERYKSEMVIYRERQRTSGQTVSTALPIRQIPADGKTTVSETDLKQKVEDGNPMSSPETESCSSTGSDSETEEASVVVETGLDSSTNIIEEATDEEIVKMTANEIDDFELRKREEAKMENKETRDGKLKSDGPGEDVEVNQEELKPNEH